MSCSSSALGGGDTKAPFDGVKLVRFAAVFLSGKRGVLVTLGDLLMRFKAFFLFGWFVLFSNRFPERKTYKSP